MAKQIFPTKGNLMALKKSCAFARNGYELMDQKRNILTREMMNLVDDVKMLRDEITKTYEHAYDSLQKANIAQGLIQELANQVPIDNQVQLSIRSVMGIEIPKVIYEPLPLHIPYSLQDTTSALDEAYLSFQRVKELTAVLAEVENSLYRLAKAIRSSQKRANALKNVVIPRFEKDIAFISDVLEEKEREEFSRSKVIKKMK